MKKNKDFDCVEMKRRIQEQIYEETKGMSHEKFADYINKRIARSRFAAFLNQPDKSRQVTPQGSK